MKKKTWRDFPAFRKARDALRSRFGTVNKSRLISQSIPYVIMFYLVDKEAWLYRNCTGGTAFDKLMAVLMNFGLPFQNPLPSLHPHDLLIGLCGAAALWAFVTYRRKNAKKFRQGEEYGSARWGTEKDIQPFIDPVFENNILLTQTERLTMNSRPSKPQYARNKNVIVIGGSGSGKTRFYVKPNLMQMPKKVSYVVTDPKGTIVIECGKMLQKEGYEIKVLNTINFRKSMHYNPFRYIRSEKDILIQKYNALQQDIDTYENNIGFFAMSKNSEPLIKQMQQKIEDAKQELKALEEKIRTVESEESNG